jgi:hypothetical protein
MMDRYSQEVNKGEPWAEPDPQGIWVLHSDAEAAVAAAMYAERARWIAACNTVSDGAERGRRPGVQTVAQVRKLAIDGPNADLSGRTRSA